SSQRRPDEPNYAKATVTAAQPSAPPRSLQASAPVSQVLIDFIAPYLPSAAGEEHLDNLLTLAMVAWNAAMLPDEKGAELIRVCLQDLPATIRADGLAIVQGLVERKKSHFLDQQQTIVDYHLAVTPEGPRLHVVFSPAD